MKTAMLICCPSSTQKGLARRAETVDRPEQGGRGSVPIELMGLQTVGLCAHDVALGHDGVTTQASASCKPAGPNAGRRGAVQGMVKRQMAAGLLFYSN